MDVAPKLSSQDEIYRTLDPEIQEFRLLIIKAGTSKDRVHTDLVHTSLSQASKLVYDTISYAWGDAAVQSSIFIRDLLLEVPASSETVLRRLRLKDQDRFVWIDAVCINQKDISERGHQVRLMYEIYANTRLNYVWLGEDVGCTAAALSSMAVLLEEMRLETDNFERFSEPPFRTANGEYLVSTAGFSLEFQQESLLQYYSSSWFSRLWVVQEVAIAPKSICCRGEHETPLEDVLRVGAWLQYKSMHLSVVHASMMRAADMFKLVDRKHGLLHRLGATITLLDLMSALRPFKALDPRDHVFGLLGFWEKSSRDSKGTYPVPEPDYTAPLANVFRDAALFEIRTSGNLEIFRHMSSRLNSYAEVSLLASWVPHWERSWEPQDGVFLKPLFRAYGDREMILTCSEDQSSVLIVDGFVLASVERSIPAPFCGSPAKSEDILGFLSLADELTQENGLEQACNNDGKLGLTLQAGVDSSGDRTNESQSACAYAGYKYFLTENQRTPYFEWSVDGSQGDWNQHANSYYDQTAAEFQFAMEAACYARMFFTTATGHIGLGPLGMRAGDTVMVLYGCQWPVVVRASALDGFYELVGVSYVYGVMDGEATRKHSLSGQPDTTISLR